MQFIHSNKQYIERTMYPINPYMNAPAVAPLTMEAFVAPADFDPDAQELNIVKAFAAYPNADKKYIFSVGTSTSTVLPAVTGRSYAYSENGGAYTTIPSGTITWTVGSTKRNVVGIDTGTSITVSIPNSAIWFYGNDQISTISGYETTIKYIHFLSLGNLINVGHFYRSSLTGKLTIPVNVIYLAAFAFQECSLITSVKVHSQNISIVLALFRFCSNITTVEFPETITGNTIGAYAFQNCSSLVSVNIPININIIDNYAFSGCSKIGFINIPVGVTAIGGDAFNSCVAAVFNNDNLLLPNLQTVGYRVFQSCWKLKIVNLIGSNINEIPSDFTYDCVAMTIFKAPSTITSIGGTCFKRCFNLSEFYFKSVTPPTIQYLAYIPFENYTATLHVPVGSLAAYQAAQYWNRFTNIIADL